MPLSPPVPRYPLLDSWVDAFTLDSFLDYVEEGVKRSEPAVIGNHNVMSLCLLQREEPFRELYRELDAIVVDGAPVVALGRLHEHELSMDNRVAVLDWIWPFFERAEARGWNVAHIGSHEPVISDARQVIAQRHPQLDLTTLSGFFDPRPGCSENEAVVAQLNELEPDVILVGMGMPRQERWVRDNRERLPDCPIITVGGILGYLGGDRPTAPRWLGPLGLEWAFRLVTEPRRLWRRYLVDPIVLVPAVAPVLRARWRARLRRRP